MAATMATLPKALLKAQGEMPMLQRNAVNPHFKNRYISLDSLMEQILPVLNTNGIVLVQAPSNIDGEPALKTTLILAATGESLSETMPLCLGKNDPQGQGSAITYARRYSLMSILGLVADVDDDAQGVQTQTSRKPKRGADNNTTYGPGDFTSSGDSPF